MFGRKKVQGPLVVRVAFRELDEPAPVRDPNDVEYGYSYVWNVPEVQPWVGLRVFAPSDGRSAAAVVVGFGVGSGGRGIQLAKISRVATMEQIGKAEQTASKKVDAWWAAVRAAAGLPAVGSVRPKLSADDDPIPPASGEASAGEAAEYGRVWWRIAKKAEETDQPVDEVKKYKSIAHRWYAVRDRG